MTSVVGGAVAIASTAPTATVGGAAAAPTNVIVTEEMKTNQRNEAKKRNITEKTEDAYWRAIKRMKRGLGLSEDDGDMDFLLDYDTVHEWIEELTLSPSSKKTYYIAIHHTIENLKDPQFSAVSKQYDTDMMAYIKKTQRPPKKKDVDVISWNEILEVRKTLEKKATKDPKNFLLDYVILSMYTFLPPSRCEYVRMKIFKGELPKDLGDNMNNYILLKERSAVVVYSDHVTIKASYPLVKVLHAWANFNKFQYLFVKVDGKPMLKNTLSQRILSIFQRETKKKLGINAIRKAYVSSVRNEVQDGGDAATV
jgi:hypothetical protein